LGEEGDVGLPYRDRRDAGRQLAARLEAYAGDPRLLVLGLPRGGVPLAFEVARALVAPLDIFLVRKVGMPGQEELALGAVATGGERVFNDELLRGVDPVAIAAAVAREERELARREHAYRAGRPAPTIYNRLIVVVDDGLATGATMRVAVAALRRQRPTGVVVAVPVGAPETCAMLRAEADDVICAAMPEPFYAVGEWYDDFAATTDEEVRALLAAAWGEHGAQCGRM
jgi:predicted phosphoribosyltransferase